MTEGITGTGEGFDLPGKRLGAFSRQPPLSSIRQVALTIAEKRARVVSLLPHGPKRLGGDNAIMSALSPVQAAAMAAKRRLQDYLWCGCESFGGSGEEKNSSEIPQTVGSRAAPSANSSKQARGSESRSANTRFCKKSRLLNNDISDLSSKVGEESSLMAITAQASASGCIENHRAADSFEDKVIWECGFCTLFNPPFTPICKAWGSENLKTLQLSSRCGLANFVPWKTTCSWINVKLVDNGDIHMDNQCLRRLLILSTGTYFAVARLSGATPPPAHVLTRSIGLQGVGMLVNGIVGATVGPTASL